MTTLPSPVPHPLEEFPLDLPRWARQALEWVVGAGWPSGDEAATWDVADRWYALADDLAGPHEAAHAAATRIVAGYHGAGIAADGFLDAWHRLSGDENAPLNALLQITQELGTLVEGCGRDIETAKLEVWIELGILLTELRGVALTTALTLGATAPAAGGLIAASRIAVEQIFDRLARQLGSKSIAAPPSTSPAQDVSRPGAAATARPDRDGGARPGRSAPRPSQVFDGPGGQTIAMRFESPDATKSVDPGGRDSRFDNGDTVLIEPGGKTRRLHLAGPSSPGSLSAHPPKTAPVTVDPVQQAYADHQREDYLRYLGTLADECRAKIRDLESGAERAVQVGAAPRGVALRRQATQIGPVVAEIEDRIKLIESSTPAPRSTSGRREPGGWARTTRGDDDGVATGAVHSDHRSALDNGGRPVDQTRHYHVSGGLRAPLAVHQVALEKAMPPAGDGRAARLADPRVGRWFELVNAGGPEDDPTRGLNCVDVVLALFDTYLHARPRVAAPRTFDAYAQGEPDRPWGGEWDALERIRLATGGTLQNLCPFVGGADPALAKPAVDTALSNLANHLHNSGHGAYAFILTDLDGGGCHAWAAVNQDGTILFLDPQMARISEEPFYIHRGRPSPANVVSMDALVVNGQGVPAPLPFHGPGQWAGLTS